MSGKLVPYEKYKDSGVEWLGLVPEGWSVRRVSALSEMIVGFPFSSDVFAFEADEAIPLVRGDNITEGYLRWGEKGRYLPKTIPHDPHYLLEANDIVVQMDGSKVGKNWAMVSKEELPLLLVQRVTRVRVMPTLATPKFVFLNIANDFFVQYVENAKTDPAIPHITQKDIADFLIPLPSLFEQRSITDFLDTQTQRIDTLIKEQQELIELLREKRQALISHAVTKGIDPKAKMKDSGVEWLGAIPERWRVGKLKFFLADSPSAIKTGPFGSQLTSADMEAGDFKVYNQRNVIDGDFTSGESYITKEKFESLRAHEVFSGDVLITTRGTIGKTAILPKDSQQGILHPCLMRIQPDNGQLNNFYLSEVINNSNLLQTQLDYLSNATTIEVIYSDTLKNVILPVPSNEDQMEILSYLGSVQDRFDALISEAESTIALMQEHRSALISAVVTGKVRVPA